MSQSPPARRSLGIGGVVSPVRRARVPSQTRLPRNRAVPQFVRGTEPCGTRGRVVCQRFRFGPSGQLHSGILHSQPSRL